MMCTSGNRPLLVVIAVLFSVIVGIAGALLSVFRGVHVAVAIRDGGIGFGGTLTLTLLLLGNFDAV